MKKDGERVVEKVAMHPARIMLPSGTVLSFPQPCVWFHYTYIRHQEEEFRHKHAGHDKMHLEMFLLLVGTLLVAQVRQEDGREGNVERDARACEEPLTQNCPCGCDPGLPAEGTSPLPLTSHSHRLKVVLTYWKKWYFSSYQTVTLLGMWVFPIIFAVRHVVCRRDDFQIRSGIGQ